MGRVAYIQRIKDEFSGMSIFQSWGVIVKKLAGGEYRTLVHPGYMKRELLRELIPRNLRIDEVLELLPVKQKEIARRLNISKLPSDRPSGMLGQTALFEILRNKGFDFKTYLHGFYKNWAQCHFEGYVLLFTLGFHHYLRRFFGYPPIDLVKSFVEPITKYELAITWDENWVNRVLSNIFAVVPCNQSSTKIHQIVKKLVRLQDGWGATASRVMEWTGETRASASHLLEVMRSSWMEHRYRLVSKNTGTVKVLTKSSSSSKTPQSHQSYCKSLKDDKDYFLSVTDVFKKDVDGKYFETEAFNTNVELFDLKEGVWKLNPSSYDARSVDDIYALLHNSDHTVPDNDSQPTRRDILYMALLLGMDTVHYPNKKQRIMRWFTEGFDIPRDEAEKGIRNVLRKNMLRNQYTHQGYADLDREFFAITFDGRSKNVIPFLGEVLPNLLFFMLQTDAGMSYGHVFGYYPSYLSCDIRGLIETSTTEHGIAGEHFVVNSWGFGHPGSILQLISDE